MPFIKKKIQKNFSKASNTYDSVAWIQKKTAIFLVSQLRKCFPDFYPETILDLGSGTGFIPQELLCYYDRSRYTLNDISPKMINVVSHKFKDNPLFSFCIGDFEEMPFSPYDLVISNMSLQWAENLQSIIKRFLNQSKVFTFSSLIEGSFAEWNECLLAYDLLDVIQQYPSKESIYQMIEPLSPGQVYFYDHSFKINFSNIREFTSYLKALGACSVKKSVPPSILKEIIRKSHVNLKITYNIIFAFVKC